MSEALIYLTNIAIVLLLGIIITTISNKLKLPNVLFLLTAGILLGLLKNQGSELIAFPSVFISSIAIVALAMVVFDSASRFKLKEFDTFSLKTIKLTVYSVIVNMILLSIATSIIFNIQLSFIVFLFAALMSGTDSVGVLSTFNKDSNKVIKTLEIESIINTPIIVLIPFIIIDAVKTFQGSSFATGFFLTHASTFLQQIITGIGAGVLVGIVVFKFMKKYYSDTISPIALIGATLLTYILAENLGGNGVLALATMGIFFGNIYLKEKDQLHEFSSVFANFTEIMIFILIGLIVSFPLQMSFIIKSLFLFVIYILIRFFIVNISFYKDNYNMKEKIFMALNSQKGIAVAVVVITLLTGKSAESLLASVNGFNEIVYLTFAFIIYSVILSTAISKFSDFFLKRPDVVEETIAVPDKKTLKKKKMLK